MKGEVLPQSEQPSKPQEGQILEAWSRQYGPALLRFFERRTRADVDREDLVQEVFKRLAQRSDLGAVERADAYIFETAANVLTDFLRRRRSRFATAHVKVDDALASETDFSPERLLIGKEAIDRLTVALGELPERVRSAFVLYHFEDMPHQTIARRLGVSLSTIEKDMARANRHLLQRLREVRE